MLEQLGSSVIFYAFYTEGGAGDTGLTVTVDVWEVTRAGTATEIVTGGSAVEIGDGVYRYLLAAGSVDAEAEYIAVFKTADTDTDQQHIPAMWVINRANVEDIDDILADTATTIPAAIALVDDNVWASTDAITTTDIWEYSSRTLTQTAQSISAAVSGSVITDVRGDTWSIEVTSVTLDANLQQFVIKNDNQDDDSESVLMIDSDTGLLYLNGAAGTAGDGSLSYAGTTLTITVAASATAQLPTGIFVYGIQSITAAGVVNEAYGGTFKITRDAVRTTT
jgi:hypothetical protein